MPTRKSPRKGSLQFWPRKRVNKFLPSVNWSAISDDSEGSEENKGLKGFICYKVGMKSAYAKDNTPDSMMKDKRITFPVTILECPTMKIYSVRFYKNGIVAKDILADDLDKELKRKVRLPKSKEKKSVSDNISKKLESIKAEDYDNLSVLVYSQVKKTGLKNKPDISEIGIVGNSVSEKLNFIKENLGKEISVLDAFKDGQLVDLRGLTKGHGYSGPVKRFGIRLKDQKSEKGRRRPGSIGPWHPARVIFRVPMAGQLGMFTRNVYNNKIVALGKVDDEKVNLKNIKNYGNVKNDFVIVRGSVQGPEKRPLLITKALRETKKQKKKNFEFLELR
jgi:large subunit ribosomal protein L3